ALPADRLAALKEFHRAGIYTWVSLEPVYDTEATLEIIRQTHEFVDLFKIGRINYNPMTHKINWQEFTARVLEVLEQTGAEHYIKKDLQPFLPSGYSNQKYRNQARMLPVLN